MPMEVCAKISLSNADGSMHKTYKSKLINQIKPHWQETTSLDVSKDTTVYIVDFIALIQVETKWRDNFELAFKLLSMLLKGFHRVDLIDDSYFSVTIKGAEGNKRGKGAKINLQNQRFQVSLRSSYRMERIKNEWLKYYFKHFRKIEKTAMIIRSSFFMVTFSPANSHFFTFFLE